MLLNLSNYPSASWPDAQRRAARERFGPVADLVFPQVPPAAGLDEVAGLASEYLGRILERRAEAAGPFAVHLMGEMTFTFILANLLKAHRIPCLASTTERTVTEEADGRKVSHFRFIGFRPYFHLEID